MKLSPAQKKTLFVVWITYAAFYLCRIAIGPKQGYIKTADIWGVEANEVVD